uniref:ADAM metallopeptidase domain 28 n=1 Tax=Ornithorhynchus anatinus TaxID=9258 RepID=F7EP17_ORNAN
MLQELLLSTVLMLAWIEARPLKEIPEKIDYEVVFPQNFPLAHTRTAKKSHFPGKQEKYQQVVQYQIAIKGDEVIFHLQKTRGLLSPDYTETHYSARGEEVTTSHQVTENCYYQGYILNERDSTVSLSICAGLRGFFMHHNQRYQIEPLKFTDQEEHAVFRYGDLEGGPANFTCGVKNSDWPENPFTSRLSNRQANFLQEEKYLELFMVLDHAFFKEYDGNLEEIRRTVFETANMINMIYKTIEIYVSLVGLEIWTDGDKIEVVPNASITLARFAFWRYDVLLKRKNHDQAHLLTGVGLRYPTVGLSYMNSMCNKNSVAIIEECTDLCCNAKSCRINMWVKCNGDCCYRCQIKKKGTLCRPAKHECDVPEVCDGRSTHCPKDQFRANGTPCHNGEGYCFGGECPTLQDQCTALWGEGSEVGDDDCYARNQDGKEGGYCKMVKNTFVPCAKKDIKCGKIFCKGGSGVTPLHVEVEDYLTCKTFSPTLKAQVAQLPTTGTKCDDDRVCMNGECLELERVYHSVGDSDWRPLS